MENVSSEMEQFVRTCEHLLSDVPPQLSEQERVLIEHFCLELFIKYGTHAERKHSEWASR